MKKFYLILVLFLFFGCSSKSDVHYFNVEKTESVDVYGILTTSNNCSIENVDGKHFRAKSFFGALGRFLASSGQNSERTVALKPKKYMIGGIFKTSQYKPITFKLPLLVEAGHKYEINYNIKNQRVYFYIEDLTSKKVVTGKKNI